jgi:hypothetical protein
MVGEACHGGVAIFGGTKFLFLKISMDSLVLRCSVESLGDSVGPWRSDKGEAGRNALELDLAAQVASR